VSYQIKGVSLNNDCWGNRPEEYSLRKDMIQHLREFFVKYNMDWIDDLIDDIYNPSITKEEIYDKYKVRFDIENSPEDKLILEAKYNQETKDYYVLLNKRIILSGKADEYKNEVVVELKRALTHEDTHRQEDQGNFNAKKVPGPENYTPVYLSHPAEINARAREIAYAQEQQGFNLEQAIENIEEEKNIEGFEEVVWWYHEIGGSVYNKFLSEIYRYLYGED
jgi:hypothetical protein